MDTKTEKRFQEREQLRLSRYQYQHRGLRFSKLWLPSSTERRVNIIGINNHIYKGQIPTLPMDQLPPEVDPDSIDDEALYKELFNMKFRKGKQPREPTGPSRRIGGAHTTAKRLYFAPIIMHSEEDRRSVPILGADGNIYRGTTKAASVRELEQQLKGTKRPVRTAAMQSSRHEYVEPAVVSLHVDGKPPMECRPQVPLIQLPIADLNKMIKYIRKKEAGFPEATAKGKEPDTTESGSEDTNTEPSDSEELLKNKDSELEQSGTEPSELDTPSELKQSSTEPSEELDTSSELEQSGTEPSEELDTPSEFEQSGTEPSEELDTSSELEQSGTEPPEKLDTPSELEQSGTEPSEKLETPSELEQSGTEPPEKLDTPSELEQSGTEPSEKLETPSELEQSGTEPSEKLETPSELEQSGTERSEKLDTPSELQPGTEPSEKMLQPEFEATKDQFSGNEAELSQKTDSQAELKDAEVYSL